MFDSMTVSPAETMFSETTNVVGLGRIYRLYLCREVVQVNEKIDASLGESVHAALVIGCRVDMVDTDGIGAQVFHLLRITLALVCVNEGIGGKELVGDA